MPLPDAIPVRYTEEEAGYVSFRPVVRQTFRIHELFDMILSVTGKDAPRVRQILRSGTLAFHSYRYRWEGFEAPEAELAEMLARFPDADPSRKFDAARCTSARIESNGSPPRHSLQLDRAAASHRPFLRRKSFWDALLAEAAASAPAYHSYSYAQRGDLYRLDLGDESRARLEAAAARAPKSSPRFADAGRCRAYPLPLPARRRRILTGGLFLDLEHASVARGEKIVLRDICLRIACGEHIAILGPNGSGKSTLIKTMTCECYPVAAPGMRSQIFDRERWDVFELRKRLGEPQRPPIELDYLERLVKPY